MYDHLQISRTAVVTLREALLLMLIGLSAAHDPSLDIALLPAPTDNPRSEGDGNDGQKTSMSDVL